MILPCRQAPYKICSKYPDKHRTRRRHCFNEQFAIFVQNFRMKNFVGKMFQMGTNMGANNRKLSTYVAKSKNSPFKGAIFLTSRLKSPGDFGGGSKFIRLPLEISSYGKIYYKNGVENTHVS